MSSDFSVRPVGTPVSAPIIQPSNQAVANAVPTDLPPSQTVTAADAGTPVRNDVQFNVANDLSVSHQAYYDRAAAALVFQVVNRKTDQVVNQYPDEAVLRRRAYFNTLDLQKDLQREDAHRVAATDRTA
ncbi:hypothetical protein SSBR45G_45480 [Bradyrhizobium sp. SSBR45G]|uniref:hypothetical protein n=1 Tax=unclassified Bradyrhizobium TaxID=2631580 RepID=UPI002342B78F|nr:MULTISPECIES: hypothetical protein [unclassified Bradyrhizobium]GLH79639.1 hypothetical protein SSBR45G_45480 [Bradyrhizobium sp. SSBR45G]GLH86966.1 hypothetical protein SSBR45R_44260 [Bradyrhizobium sp. SSBR45R]